MKCIVSLFVFLQIVSFPVKSQGLMPDSLVICFVDSKIVEYQAAALMLSKNEVKGTGEVISARNAILHFGERARNGIWTFWTLHKAEEAPLQPDEYLIYGTVSPAYNGEQVMLFTFEPTDWDKIQHVDTVMVADGKFTFRGKVCDNNPSVLTVGNYPKPTHSVELLLEAGEMHVSLDSMIVAGTPLNDEILRFEKCMKESSINISKTKPDSLKMELIECRRTAYKDFVKKNIRNGIGRAYLYKKNYQLPDFEELYALADDTLKNTPEMVAIVKKHNEEVELRKKLLKLAGEKYKNHAFLTLSGEQRDLKEYIGKSKILVIDVWASWCAPCRREIPYLKKVYETYKNKGLNVLSVSLDESEDNWKSAVKQMDMPWSQLRIEPEEKQNAFMKDYLIHRLPHLIIINEEGKIVCTGSELRAEGGSLQALLNKYLK